MKTAEQWQEELAGETSVQSIRRIQANALVAATILVVRCRRTGIDPVSELAILTDNLSE